MFIPPSIYSCYMLLLMMTNSPAGSLRHGPPLGFVRWHLPGASARQPACGVDALPRSLPGQGCGMYDHEVGP